MKFLIVFIFLFAAAAHAAIDPGEQLIVDDYIRTHRTGQTAAASDASNPSARMAQVKQSVENMTIQANSMNTQISSNQRFIDKSEQRLKERQKYQSLYDFERFRTALVEDLSKECCRLVKNPDIRAKKLENIRKRFEKLKEEGEQAK